MIRRSSLASLFAIACVVSSSSRAWAQHVLVVDASGPYTQIQPAVDAAANGDTVLVHAGTYDGFAIGDKEVSVVAAIGANVQVAGRVRVDNFAHPHAVLLAGLHIQPTGIQPAGAPAFGAQGNSGNIRIELCTITGVDSTVSGDVGQLGVELEDDNAVAFGSCTIQAGQGAPGWYGNWAGCAGGHAISARSSRVAVYDCILRGGMGGHGHPPTNGTGAPGGAGGRGGSGYRLDDGLLFVAGSQIYGGDGGQGGDGGFCCFLCGGGPGDGGPGGHGLFAFNAAPPHPNFVTLADMLIPGTGGAPGINGNSYCWSDGYPGGNGSSIAAPSVSVSELPGRVRMLAAPRVAHENTIVPLAFHGVPGDQVQLYVARTPAFVLNEPFHGVNLTAQPPHARLLSFGTIPASGTLNTHIVLPDLGLDAKTYFLQSVFMSATGQWFLGSPDTLIDLDSAY